jgi:signal transduction histidine kinase
VFSAVAASIILLFLLSETTMLYWRLARSHLELERERDNKLLSFQAIAAAISHEIKQPLTALMFNGKAALALLGKSPPDVEEAREALSDIVSDGQRVGGAIDGISALFRKVDESRQPINMNRLVLEVLQSLRGELNAHGVSAKPEFATGLPLINGNSNQLHEVIFNLVHNAVEAMDGTTERTRELRLMTRRRDRDTIAVTVQDSGPGIDPAQIGGIFDAFVTTKAHGMGLGLAICRAIVERHGGELSASSDGKTGTLFHLVLPIAFKDEHGVRAE